MPCRGRPQIFGCTVVLAFIAAFGIGAFLTHFCSISVCTLARLCSPVPQTRVPLQTLKVPDGGASHVSH